MRLLRLLGSLSLTKFFVSSAVGIIPIRSRKTRRTKVASSLSSLSIDCVVAWVVLGVLDAVVACVFAAGASGSFARMNLSIALYATCVGLVAGTAGAGGRFFSRT